MSQQYRQIVGKALAVAALLFAAFAFLASPAAAGDIHHTHPSPTVSVSASAPGSPTASASASASATPKASTSVSASSAAQVSPSVWSTTVQVTDLPVTGPNVWLLVGIGMIAVGLGVLLLWRRKPKPGVRR